MPRSKPHARNWLSQSCTSGDTWQTMMVACEKAKSLPMSSPMPSNIAATRSQGTTTSTVLSLVIGQCQEKNNSEASSGESKLFWKHCAELQVHHEQYQSERFNSSPRKFIPQHYYIQEQGYGHFCSDKLSDTTLLLCCRQQVCEKPSLQFKKGWHWIDITWYHQTLKFHERPEQGVQYSFC